MVVQVQDVLKAARFRVNPFRIVPPAEMDNVEWAGDRGVIDTLLDAARAPRADVLGTSELVVLYGEFGSGKTNALKYLAKYMRDEDALVAYLVRPSVMDKPTWHDVARSLFTQAFRREDVAERLEKLRKYVRKEARERAQAALGADSDNPDALEVATKKQEHLVAEEILPESPGFIQFALDLAAGKKERNWAYLADKPNAALGKEISSAYGLPADGLSTDYGATLLLGSLVRTLTFQTKHGVGAEVVCILMDEMEGIIELAPASRLSILLGIRELFNTCTEHLFIAVAASASDASEMWGILDAALMQRLSRLPIQFPQLETSEARQFLLEIMSLARDKDYEGPNEWPFSADGLEAFVTACPPPLTPRKLLVSAARIALQKEATKVLTGQAIDSVDVSEFTAWGAS